MSFHEKLNSFTQDLVEVPINMRLFSLALRSLYSENALGSSSDIAKELNKIRDDTTKDALVYVKGILPLSTQVVRSIKDFFEYYEELSEEDWRANLSDILDEVKGYKQCCTEVVSMHEKIMIPLKKRQDEASVLVSKLKDLSSEYDERIKELEESASTKRGWGFALAFIPGVNVIATPLLGISAYSDIADAVAHTKQLSINNAAAYVISNTLIPAITAFVDGLNAAAGFFSVIENELAAFLTKGDAAKENAKSLHYIMMKKKATEINGSCRAFYAMIPGVRTDLECIPQNPDDMNYVDRWLKKQKEEIEEKYANRITGQLRKMIGNLTSKGDDQLMIE